MLRVTGFGQYTCNLADRLHIDVRHCSCNSRAHPHHEYHRFVSARPSMRTGLHAPAVQSDLAHVCSQRVGQPCHLHLTCSHIHRRNPCNILRSRGCRRDASESAACLSHSSRTHKRRLDLSTCAVADEVRQAAAQSSAEPSIASDSPVAAQELKPEAAAAVSAAASGTPGASAEKQSASPTQEPSSSQPVAAASPSSSQTAPTEQAPASAQSNATPAGPAPTSTPSTQPPAAPGASYKGFRNVQHNSDQKGPDSETGTRMPRGFRPIPIPPEEAGWIMPGQTVLAKVVYSNNNGFKVEMANDTRVGA